MGSSFFVYFLSLFVLTLAGFQQVSRNSFKEKFLKYGAGDIENLRSYLWENAQCDPFFLSNAVKRNESEIVEELLKHDYKCSVNNNAMSLAFSYGYFPIARLLIQYKVPFVCFLNTGDTEFSSYFDIDDAVKEKDTERLEYLYENGCHFTKNTLSQAAFNGDLELMKWLRDRDCPWGSGLLEAVQRGDMHTLEWLKENNCPLNTYHVSVDIKRKDSQKAQWMLKNGCSESLIDIDDFKRRFNYFTSANIPEIQNYLSQNTRCDPYFLSIAVIRDEYDIVKLLLENNYKCSQDKNALNIAFERENFQIMGLLINYKVPFSCTSLSEKTLNSKYGKSFFELNDAVDRNDMERLEYLFENGCPFQQNTLDYAVSNGNIILMKWLKRRGCPWGPNLLKAVKPNSENVLNWLKYNHCPLSRYKVSDAIEQRDLKKASWMMNNGCRINDDIFDFVRTGDDYVMNWLREKFGNKIKDDETDTRKIFYSPYFTSIEELNKKRINWLNEISFPVDGLSLERLVELEDFESIKLLCPNNCRLTPELLETALLVENLDIVVWLIENDCPLGEGFTEKLEAYFQFIQRYFKVLQKDIEEFKKLVIRKNNSYIIYPEDSEYVLQILKICNDKIGNLNK
jgi:hypothetical protein